jgi:hypothetical protein
LGREGNPPVAARTALEAYYAPWNWLRENSYFEHWMLGYSKWCLDRVEAP